MFSDTRINPVPSYANTYVSSSSSSPARRVGVQGSSLVVIKRGNIWSREINVFRIQQINLCGPSDEEEKLAEQLESQVKRPAGIFYGGLGTRETLGDAATISRQILCFIGGKWNQKQTFVLPHLQFSSSGNFDRTKFNQENRRSQDFGNRFSPPQSVDGEVLVVRVALLVNSQTNVCASVRANKVCQSNLVLYRRTGSAPFRLVLVSFPRVVTVSLKCLHSVPLRHYLDHLFTRSC